jgi:Allene oxide cyclase barrel like domain
MRTRLGIVAAVAAALALYAAGPAAADGDSEVIKLFAVTVQSAELDLGDEGPSVGDRYVFADDVYDRKGGDQVGTNGGECTIVRVDAEAATATANCLVTFSLDDRGQLTIQGLVDFSVDADPTFTLPVTGGSGDFAGAAGEVEVEELSETEANLTFTLD